MYFRLFALFAVSVMISPSQDTINESSGSRSHVFVLYIEDEDTENVLRILDSLRQHRGWGSAGLGFDCQASTELAAECCGLSLRRFDPNLRYPDSIYPEQYSTVDRNLSLLVPDRPDPLLFAPVQPLRSSTPGLSGVVPTPAGGIPVNGESFDADTTLEVTGDSTSVVDSILDAGIILFPSFVGDLIQLFVFVVLVMPADSLADWSPVGSSRQVPRISLQERLRQIRLRRSSQH